MGGELLRNVSTHGKDLRGRIYDIMGILEDADLTAHVPFAESQDLLYQSHCMLGAQESWHSVLPCTAGRNNGSVELQAEYGLSGGMWLVLPR